MPLLLSARCSAATACTPRCAVSIHFFLQFCPGSHVLPLNPSPHLWPAFCSMYPLSVELQRQAPDAVGAALCSPLTQMPEMHFFPHAHYPHLQFNAHLPLDTRLA